MKALIELLKSLPSDNFCPEMFCEYFVEGQLEDHHISNLSGEQMDEVCDAIDWRYGNAWAQKFDDRALPLLNI